MYDRYYCIKVSKKSILGRYFDVLFWQYFVLIFLHRHTKMISIDILVTGQSVNNCSIMAGNLQEFTTWWPEFTKYSDCLPFYSNFFNLRRHVWLYTSPFRPASISVFIPSADTRNNNSPEIDY